MKPEAYLYFFIILVADAWAKIPAGIFYGNNMDMGNFDECLSINEHLDASTHIEGKYCMSTLSTTRKQMENDLSSSNEFQINLGICIPTACDEYEVELALNKHIEKYWNMTSYNSSAKLEQKCISENRGSFKFLDWIAILVLVTLGALLILGTSYEYLAKNQKKSSFLSAFSIPNNMSQLIRMTPNNKTSNHVISSLNGIRSLSIIWIIFHHTYALFIQLPSINDDELSPVLKTPFAMILRNGIFAVDTFFFMSGLLLVSVAFREMEKNSGKLDIPHLYLHRFIRISPSLYMCVLLAMTLFPFSVNGPLWGDGPERIKDCESTWWATLLYLQNYVANRTYCLPHSWYLAVDTQLYLISPLVLIPIWRWRKWGLVMLGFIGLLLFFYLFSLIILKEVIVYGKVALINSPDMYEIYFSTHTRAFPWIIGIVFGYYLHFRKNQRTVLSKLSVILGWVFAIGIFLTVIFAMYPAAQHDPENITPLEGAFYLPLSYIAWPLGLCWIIFACINGYGGPINDFLSCVIWQPISKISYCMYIWHRLVVYMNGLRIKTNSHISSYDLILQFWNDFGISLIVATLMYLAIEAPITEVEKYLRQKKRSAQVQRETSTNLEPKSSH